MSVDRDVVELSGNDKDRKDFSPYFVENYFAEVKIENDHMIDKMEDRVFNKYDDVLIM
jgi:hypothetical protein